MKLAVLHLKRNKQRGDPGRLPYFISYRADYAVSYFPYLRGGGTKQVLVALLLLLSTAVTRGSLGRVMCQVPALPEPRRR